MSQVKETYLNNGIYVKTRYDKGVLSTWYYPYSVLSDEIVTVDICKGKNIHTERGKKNQIDEFHSANIFKLAILNSIDEYELDRSWNG